MQRSYLPTKSSGARPESHGNGLIRLIATFLLAVGLTMTSVPTTAQAGTMLNVPGSYPSISAALLAAEDGDTVLVAPGRYFGSFVVPSGVTVRSQAGPSVTSVQFWNSAIVRGGTIEGFTFLMTEYSRLGIESPGGVIRHNILTVSESPDVNTSYPGIYVAGEDTTGAIDGNLIHGLKCDTPTIDNAMIRLNSGSAEVTNNLIVGNSCVGIGLKSTLTDHAAIVANNTVAGATRGVAIEAGGSGANKVFRNNIISGGETGFELIGTPDPAWTNNLVHGNATQFVGMVDPTGTDGNLASDPAFVATGPSPYRLMAGSPAVDAGTATDAPPADFFGTPRPIDGDGDLTPTPDIGAYELGGTFGSIEGTVTSRSTGSGVPDVCAVAVSAGGSAFGVPTTTDGAYTLEVAADDYAVHFIDCLLNAYLDQWYNDVAEQGLATTVGVAAEATVTGIDAALDIGIECNGHVGTIVGTLRSDVIAGTDNADVILGMGGDDTIDALRGDDIVCGGDGDDLIRAHGGADHVDGGSGHDEIFGGVGADHLLGGDGNDTIDAGPGDDYVDGQLHDDTIDGGEGRDTLDGYHGDDVIAGGPHPDTIRGGYGDDMIKGEGGSDHLGGWHGDDTIRGGGGNDVLTGASGDDTLLGGAGSDNLIGGNDDDWLEGGSGDDVLDGQAGVDVMVFSSAPQRVKVNLATLTLEGDGADTFSGIEGVVGSDFDDVLRGDDFDNMLRGGRGNDKLYGYKGDDRLDGEGGDDRLYGHEGADYLRGGPGDDRMVDGPGNDDNDGRGGADFIMSQPGNDVMYGGDGFDTVSFQDAPEGITLGRHGRAQGHGADTVTAEKIIGSDFDDDLMADAHMDGRAGNDIIRLQGGGNVVLRGGSGDDRIIAENHKETIYGGSGNDNIWAGGANDEVYGGSGNDVIRAGSGHDLIDGGAGDDKLLSGFGDDVIIGGDGDDDMFGDVGEDLLIGGAGNDILDGSRDDDVLVGEAGHDTLVGGAGSDTASYAWAVGVKVSLTGGWATGDGNDTLSSMEWIVGSEGNDVLTGSSVPNLIEARGGNDTVYGLDSSDLLVGNAGNDTLYGGNHNDYLYGDEGTDILNGGAGSDECHDGETNTSCETTGAALADSWSTDRSTGLRDWLTTALGAEAADRLLRYLPVS